VLVVNINKLKTLGLVICIAVAFALPLMGLKAYYLHIAVLGLIHGLLVLGLNLIAGYTGQLSLAQAGFFGLGSYITALLMLNAGMSFWLAALLGILATGTFAACVGLPTLRLKGPYFVISTLGLGEIIRLVFVHWESVTRGPNGLAGIPAPDPIDLGFMVLTFESKTSAYYLILVVLLVTIYFYHNLIDSRVGRAFRAIRDDSIAAEVMGINLTAYKVLAFAAGAMLSALAGALYTSYIRFISPDTFTIGEAVNILIMLVLGGMGTISGALAGALGITYLLETMRIFADYRMVIYGLLMFVIIVYMPQGLAGLGNSLLERMAIIFSPNTPKPVAKVKAELPHSVEGEV